jgi:hypothetical protein
VRWRRRRHGRVASGRRRRQWRRRRRRRCAGHGQAGDAGVDAIIRLEGAWDWRSVHGACGSAAVHRGDASGPAAVSAVVVAADGVILVAVALAVADPLRVGDVARGAARGQAGAAGRVEPGARRGVAQVAAALLQCELVHEARTVGERVAPLRRRRREVGAEALEVSRQLAQLHLARLLVSHALRRHLGRGHAHAGLRGRVGLLGGLLQEGGLRRLLLDVTARQPRVPAGEVEPPLAPPSAPLAAVGLVSSAAGQPARTAAGRTKVAEAQAERGHLVRVRVRVRARARVRVRVRVRVLGLGLGLGC